jgi:hypothetical protein
MNWNWSTRSTIPATGITTTANPTSRLPTADERSASVMLAGH